VLEWETVNGAGVDTSKAVDVGHCITFRHQDVLTRMLSKLDLPSLASMIVAEVLEMPTS
jgi:hypothetical protein